jgi:hypothetical protein
MKRRHDLLLAYRCRCSNIHNDNRHYGTRSWDADAARDYAGFAVVVASERMLA